jgi:uncharacterized protein YjeT (DUF2065 family)
MRYQRIATFIDETIKEGILYVVHPRFWVTVVLGVSFCQLAMSLSFLLFPDVFDISATYRWLSTVFTQHEFGFYGLMIALSNFIFIKRGIMALLFPSTIGYWLLLSYGTLISVNGITPGAALTLSITTFCAIAYISAGGLNMLYYRGQDESKYGYYSKKEEE